jgi:hypothetical protein
VRPPSAIPDREVINLEPEAEDIADFVSRLKPMRSDA